MMGLTPADLVDFCREFAPSPVAYGANCGVGAAELVVTVMNLSAAAGPDGILVAKANCGIPEYVNGALRYNGTPALMADYARFVRDAGARIIGGCCGTTPVHIQAMKTALEAHRPGVKPDLENVIARLGEISTGARAQLRGEMDPLQGAASGEGKVQRGMRGRRRQR
jgi:5-methyltetrahydrofolate--homocysteine methyltransferase